MSAQDSYLHNGNNQIIACLCFKMNMFKLALTFDLSHGNERAHVLCLGKISGVQQSMSIFPDVASC